jgi:hypothetical protein
LDYKKIEEALQLSSVEGSKEGSDEEEDEEKAYATNLQAAGLPFYGKARGPIWMEAIRLMTIENNGRPYVVKMIGSKIDPKFIEKMMEVKQRQEEENGRIPQTNIKHCPRNRESHDKERKRKSRKETALQESNCGLCGGSFPIPSTARMYQAHPGCQKPTFGLGYNPDGQYCGGWVGNCGEGGIQVS